MLLHRMENAAVQIRLSDGRLLDVSVWRHPTSWTNKATIIDLWLTEWTATGFDWFPWLDGAYANVLVTETAIGWLDGIAIATATVCYPVREPETCVVMNVVTFKNFRGLGIANQLTSTVVERAFATGCVSAYLGNTPTPHSAYEKCGFERLAGVFMRRVLPDAHEVESQSFAAGQRTATRIANWGDIPGCAALVSQPLQTMVLDFPRGLISAKYHPPEQGLTQFSSVWYGSTRAGGNMHVLRGNSEHRILGFGAYTPGLGPARRSLADFDFFCHDNYRPEARKLLQSLIDEAKSHPHLQRLRLRTAETDNWKREYAEQCGFAPAYRDNEELRLFNDNWPVYTQLMSL